PAVARRTLRTAGMWESVVATRLAEVEAMDGVRLAYLPDPAEVKIRISVAGDDGAERRAGVQAGGRGLLRPAVDGADAEAYATEVKRRALGVPAELLAEHGAAHPDVAAARAAGVRDALGATYGIAVTGVAGPEPQDGRPVGTVYVGVAGPEGPPVVAGPKLPVPGSGAEARGVIRRMTGVHALDLLRRPLLGLDVEDASGKARADREDLA